MLGQELVNYGCRVTIATIPYYRTRVEGTGLLFRSIRPDLDPTDARLIRSCEDLRRGPEVLYRQIVLPELGDCRAENSEGSTESRTRSIFRMQQFLRTGKNREQKVNEKITAVNL